ALAKGDEPKPMPGERGAGLAPHLVAQRQRLLEASGGTRIILLAQRHLAEGPEGPGEVQAVSIFAPQRQRFLAGGAGCRVVTAVESEQAPAVQKVAEQ